MNAVTMTQEVKISRMALFQAHAALLLAVRMDRAGDQSRLDRQLRDILSKERIEALDELSKALQDSAPGAAR
jgi:hypothetical protein